MATSGADFGALLTAFLGHGAKGYGEQRKYEAEKNRLAAEALVKKQQEAAEEDRKNRELLLKVEEAKQGKTTAIPDGKGGFQLVQSEGISPESAARFALPGMTGPLPESAYQPRPKLPGAMNVGPGRSEVKFPPNAPNAKPMKMLVEKSKLLADMPKYNALQEQGVEIQPIDDTKQTQLTPTLKKKKVDLNSAIDTVNQLEEAWNNLSKKGGTGLKLGTLKSYVGAATEQNPDAVRYGALKDSLVAFIGRNIGSDVGNFAEKEAKLYKKMLAAFFSDDSSAKVRFDEMRRSFQDKLDQIDSQGVDSGGSKKDSLGIR